MNPQDIKKHSATELAIKQPDTIKSVKEIKYRLQQMAEQRMTLDEEETKLMDLLDVATQLGVGE